MVTALLQYKVTETTITFAKNAKTTTPVKTKTQHKNTTRHHYSQVRIAGHWGTWLFETPFWKGLHYPTVKTHALWIKPTDALNSNCTGITTLYVSGSLCYRLLPGVGWNCSSILLLVANGSSQLHKMYQSRCRAKNSWWWAERLPETFIYSVFCLTTGPKPPLKRFLHIVRSRASSFKWQYPLLS